MILSRDVRWIVSTKLLLNPGFFKPVVEEDPGIIRVRSLTVPCRLHFCSGNFFTCYHFGFSTVSINALNLLLTNLQKKISLSSEALQHNPKRFCIYYNFTIHYLKAWRSFSSRWWLLQWHFPFKVKLPTIADHAINCNEMQSSIEISEPKLKSRNPNWNLGTQNIIFFSNGTQDSMY